MVFEVHGCTIGFLYFCKMKGKAIVMGATSGIGREVALFLAEKGWQVGIAGRREDRLGELMKLRPYVPSAKGQNDRGGIVASMSVDVTRKDASDRLRQLIGRLGGMDLYFHSSGVGWQNEPLDMDKELATVETNCMGFVRMVDTAFRWFAEQSQGGKSGRKGKYRIACISSIAGTKGLGAAPAYSSTKRFQNHYLECLSQLAHMRRLPIAITDLRPGFVKTDLIAGSAYPLQLDARVVARHIVNAIEKGRETKVIDWRYALLVSLWRLLPRWIWTRLDISSR